LPGAPVRLERLDRADCLRALQLELFGEDANSFRDLARSASGAGALGIATGGRPARSARYRELLAPRGFNDELRAVLRTGDSPWGIVTLLRQAGRPAFGPAEVELVAGLSRPLGEAIRDHARRLTPASTTDGPSGPGLLLFAADGRLVSANDDAGRLLAELSGEPGPQGHATSVPFAVATTMTRARAIAEQRERGIARTRIRSPAGRWLACHASCLADADGGRATTAVVIEPATPADIASLVVAAHDLTTREQQITQLLARGLGTTDLATSLRLSRHTVRGYIKGIFDKVDVSSRGELVAKLFGPHHGLTPSAPAAGT
jgi:DNA-binding CsgD family transcriptional regulator